MIQICRRINKCLIIFVLGLFYFNVSAQNIEAYYVNMPDDLNPILGKQNRLELLEYYKAGQGDSTTNRFGNKVQLLRLDTIHNLLVVKNTRSSVFEMKLHRIADSSLVIGIIRTVCAPVCHSTVEFYDTAWNSLRLTPVLPKAIDWFNTKVEMPENPDMNWVKSLLEDSFVSLSFDPSAPEIVAQNNSLDFQTEENRKILRPLLLDAKFRIRLADLK